VCLFGAVWCHLVDTPICHASDELLALGAPCRAADLGAKYKAVLGGDKLLLGQIRHVQVAVAGDNGAECSGFGHRVGDEGPERLAVRAELKGRLCSSLDNRLNIVYRQTTTVFGRDDEELLVGRKGELRDAKGERKLGLGGKGSDFAIAILRGFKCFPDRLCTGYDDAIGGGRSNEAFSRCNAEERRRGGGGLVAPFRSQLDSGIASNREEAEALEPHQHKEGRGRSGRPTSVWMTSSFGPSVSPPAPAEEASPIALATLPKLNAMMVGTEAPWKRDSRFPQDSAGSSEHRQRQRQLLSRASGDVELAAVDRRVYCRYAVCR
jgi:hypothetical protein